MVVLCPDCIGSGQDQHTTVASAKDLLPCGRCDGSGILVNHWRTREGEILYIPDMGDKHIVNSILMLERNVKNFRFKYGMVYMMSLPTPKTDLSQDALNMELDWMVQMTDVEWLNAYHKTYKELTAEAGKRKIL